jgi:hypothetical protein
MKLPGVLLTTFAFAAGFMPSFAQDAAQPIPIQGVVLERASRSPIAGATINLSIVNNPAPQPVLLNTTADNGGRFTVSIPGGSAFNLIVSATGYQGYQQRQPPAGQNDGFIEVTLDRLAEIRGRLVDDETRKPIGGLNLALVRADILTISMSPMGVPVGTTTQDDGSFAFKGLTRGDYYLRIESPPKVLIQEIPAKDLAAETRDKALEVPEPAEGYGIVLWPGEDTATPQAPPLKLTSDVLDVGEIRLRPYKLHNLSGVLGACKEGAGLQVLLLGKNIATAVRLADLDTACGNGFRILNLPEGSFTLIAQGGPPRMFISEAINGNTHGPLLVNVAAAVSVQMLIEVEDVPRTNLPDDFQYTRIALTPENAPVKIDAPDKISPGEYEAHLFGNERYRLSVIPPPAYYLKRLSYNGVASDDLTGFTAVAGALSTLRLVMSNHPGIIDVQAPRGNSVYLLKEGAKPSDFQLGGRTFQLVGANGRVRFAGLSPGRYHAYLSNGTVPFSQSGLDEMVHSETVTVEEGQTSSVTLEAPH